jgi:hypothetical protein
LSTAYNRKKEGLPVPAAKSFDEAFTNKEGTYLLIKIQELSINAISRIFPLPVFDMLQWLN